MNFLVFITILITVFLLFMLFDHLFGKPEKEFTSIMTLLTLAIVGLIIYNFEVQIRPVDLIYCAVAIFAVYLFYPNKEKKVKHPIVVDFVNGFRDKKEIISKLKEIDLEEYFFLKLEYEKGNVQNKKFQRRYKNFYNMYPFGFTEKFYNAYFKMMEEGETNLKTILNTLSKIKDKKGEKSVQLAFASKLLHMVDSEMPLYNSTVAKVFNLQIRKGTIDEKVDHSIVLYQKLQNYYQQLLQQSVIKEIIEIFRDESNLNQGVLSDAKLIDMIIKVKQNKPQ